MEFNNIEHKKPFYKIKAPLREHLKQYSRLEELPITYDDLSRYEDLMPIMDDNGKNTLWYSVLYRKDEISYFQQALVRIYQLLIADGDEIPYLKIESIDFCSFGNSGQR